MGDLEFELTDAVAILGKINARHRFRLAEVYHQPLGRDVLRLTSCLPYAVGVGVERVCRALARLVRR